MSAKVLPIMRDMSRAGFEVLPDRGAKTEQARLRKQRQREKLRGEGMIKIEIELSAEDAALFAWLRAGQSGPVESFVRRALMTGAKFCFNSGNVRGGKKRFRS